MNNYFRELIQLWNSFWFTPRASETFGVLRICTGLMLAYTHAIWLYDVESFLGKNAWIDGATIRLLHSDQNHWSYLWSIDSTWFIVTHQWVAITLSLAMALGLMTRCVVPAIWFMTLMVCHRMTGLLFGLDQVIMMLTMYLMIAPCGSCYSVDRWIQQRRLQGSWLFPSSTPSVMTNIATRLLQIQLCIIYFFGGISKLRGEMWWDGTAMWYAAASYEYQSMDLTWIGRYPFLGAILTHATVFWETLYCALVWPKATRPWVIAMAIAVHAGIAIYLGMVTFGCMMIVANGAFISPEFTRRIFQAVLRWPAPSSSDTELRSAPGRR